MITSDELSVLAGLIDDCTRRLKGLSSPDARTAAHQAIDSFSELAETGLRALHDDGNDDD